MHLTWKERLDQNPSLWDFKNWPVIPHSEIHKDKRKQFILHLQVIALVLDRTKFEIISRQYSISTSKISKLMTRCLAGDEAFEPPLTRALIPNTHISKSIRRNDLPTLLEPTGTACSFTTLLYRVPGLKDHLDAHLLADIRNKPWGRNIKPKSFHSTFLEYLSQHAWPSNCYPYTEPLRGYESCRKYLDQRIQELILEDREKKAEPHRVVNRRLSDPPCFGQIQIDEHHYDSPSTILISIEGRISPIRVSRISLVVAVEVSTQLNLSYVLVLSREPNHHEIIECIKRIYRPWSPIEFKTPGFRYISGAAFPAGTIFDEDTAPAIGEISLDNAMSHHANAVRVFIIDSDTLGATFHAGIPACPKTRNWVEYSLNLLEQTTHALKSTSGTGPSDPNKESKSNSKKPPIISLVALEECIEMILANENAKPRSTLKLETPLTDCESLLSNTYVPRLPRINVQNVVKSVSRVKLPIHRDKDGYTYVYFYYRKYKGKALYSIPPNEAYVYAEYDNDIRTINIISIYGECIGLAYAPRSWQSHPHSTRTRSIIHKLTRHKRIKTPDYLVWYFNYLLEHKKLPKYALELVRAYREFTDKSIRYKPVIEGEIIQENSFVQIDDDELEDFPEWSSEFFNIEENKDE